jgi:uncharacterized protein (DUF433 family)
MAEQQRKQRITIEPGKRGGKPCIRGLRITVRDVLGMLSNGMRQSEIIEDFPELEANDIRAALAYAADREHSFFRCRIENRDLTPILLRGGLVAERAH